MAVRFRVDITGTSDVLRKLNAEIQGIEHRTQQGVMMAARRVRKVAIPLTPKERGWLRGEGDSPYEVYVRSVGRSGHPEAEIGYTAPYANIVHEVEAKHYTTPGTGWKFLERAIQATYGEVLEIIRRHAHVNAARLAAAREERETARGAETEAAA